MGAIRTEADQVYRDYNVDAVPSSGARQPVKQEIRTLFSHVDSLLTYAPAAAVVADNLTAFADTTGKVLKDSGVKTSEVAKTTGHNQTGPITLGNRAELWLDTSSNFRLRTSPDGALWVDSIIADKTDGTVKVLAGTLAHPGISLGTVGDGFYQPSAGVIAAVASGVAGTRFTSQGSLMPAGTPALPGMSFVGDNDTGICNPAANTVAISTNGGGTLYTFDGTGFNLAPKVGSLAFSMESTNNGMTVNFTSGADDPTLRTILNLRRARTIDPVSPVVEGADNIGAVAFQGSNGAGYTTVCRLLAVMTEPIPGPTAMGAKLRMMATPVGSTSLTSWFDLEGGVGLNYNGNPILDDNRLFIAGAGSVAKPGYTFWVDPDTGMHRPLGNVLSFATGGFDALQMDGQQHVYGFKLHNNASPVTGPTNQYIASGTYTPTLFNTLNLAASAASPCLWMRVGNVVTVSGKVNVDPTAAAATTLGMSLPIASDLVNDYQCSGSACCAAVAGQCAAILGDPATDRATMQWTAVDIAPRDMQFVYTYVIQ